MVTMTKYALYLDDAGHPSDQPFLAIAGFVASESQWLAFEPLWKATLDSFDVLFPFHMTDFMQEPMSKLRREQILAGLAQVIKKHTICAFVCAVDMDAWKQVNNKYALDECHGAPIALATRQVWGELHRWMKAELSSQDHVLTFIEEGSKHYGQIEQVLKRDKIPIPVKVPKSMPAVQPSDILAWEAFNNLRSGNLKKPSKNLNQLTKRDRLKHSLGSIFYEHDLVKLCRDTNVNVRADLRPGDTIRFHSERKRVRRRLIK